MPNYTKPSSGACRMPYKRINTKNIYRGRIFDIVKTKLSAPDGKVFNRETVVHPGASAIVPLMGKDKVLLVNQFRYATGQMLWEIPAGTLYKNEPPFRCARRELEEETGFTAKTIKKATEFYSCPGFCTEKIHLYLAQGLSPGRNGAKQDADENIHCRIFSKPQIIRMLNNGKIKDAKSIIGLILWLQKKI